ncbi:hypothetical protein A9W99_04690 [Mycobacterium sp. 1164966.3]|uniref:hypothetical protein n=1 Tax=Mycobacterium sp. 1164966.3 TaxID=1856861 RepID=UPI0007FFDD62|nr:hypothetical protein [Mycobacterium sp. 1164966.3]OBA77812.1 hypothetical protein A9W99_04690 [Mycobacterium sp. 1164966.3]
MTTHEHQTVTESQVPEAAPSGAPPPSAGLEQSQSQQSGAAADHAVASEETTPRPEVAPASAEPASTTRESPTAETLFADDELGELRARWAGVQAAFVDDPKECVQKADVLVSDLVEQLTTGFAQARSRLEEQWAQGREASTEDLRLALMHYREFFERLLAV